jgi:hypothetical protein
MPDWLRISLRGLLAVIGFFMLTTAQSSDRIDLPPEVRLFQSPSGVYEFEVRAVDGWKQPQSEAELFAVGPDAGRRSLWRVALPHRYGPGLAFVTDAGRVLLIDEWMKTPSSYAVQLFAVDGEEIARHSMADIVALTGVPGSEIVTIARVGPWMSAPPTLSPTQDSVLVEAGGVPLAINLQTGHVSRVQ